MVLLYCGTMPTHKLAKDDREGDETHTAVDGLMIVGGSTCTRSGVCVSAASVTDIGEGPRSQLLSRVLGDRRAHSGESGSGRRLPSGGPPWRPTSRCISRMYVSI